jgi:16S rRNA (guanine966-N2)-methyltransferase
MRIISGTCGGHSLRVPKTVLRPTTDRTRSAVFSILGNRVTGKRVADLFAGSGAYGLECLSRGATHCVFVDNDRMAEKTIGQNLEKTKLQRLAEIHTAKVDSWWTRPHLPFDLIFADPPYKKTEEDRDWNPEILKSEFLPKLLAPQGILILESWAHAWEQSVPEPWTCVDERKYGAARVRFFQRTTDLPPVAETESESP